MLFLHARAPYGPLSSSAVGHLVAQACRRAGLPQASAHQLRHVAATAMRRAGAPLSEISQLLRHQHEGTTSKYGTIDPDELGPVTHPWPGEAS
jgi:integrase